jgi:WD40 repeat protein
MGERAVAVTYDVVTGQLLCAFQGHSESVIAVAFSPDGKRVLTGSDDNTAILWSATGGKLRDFRAGAFYSSVFAVAFTPDGKHVLAGSQDTEVKMWDAETGKLVRTFRGHTGIVCCLAFSPDGKVLLSGSTDKTAILRDAATGKKLRTLGPLPLRLRYPGRPR